MKKFVSFLYVAIYIFATIGSFGTLLYYGQPQFAIANLGLSYLAYPKAWAALQDILH